LINLLGNAVKFTKEGGISLQVSSFFSETGNALPNTCSSSFEVKDTGVGIAAEDLDKVFDVFYQSESGLHSQKGTGLDLVICQKFSELMGGRITVNGQVANVSVFRFDGPVDGVADNDVQEVLSPRTVIGLEPAQHAYRLLVAADDDAYRNMVVRLMHTIGCEVREAVNGAEAIDVCEKWNPHLIWMDIRMPVLDGLETTRRIKAAPYGKDIIIIALTASAFEEDRQKILECGFDYFVIKPFRENEIFEMLRKHLGVQYVYDDEILVEGKDQKLTVGPELTLARFNVLSGQLREKFKKAVDATDFDASMNLVNRIRKEDMSLAEAIEALIHSYQFEVLQKLCVDEEMKQSEK